jgi:two-component system, sensor histidine kinase and response regulator
VISGLYDLRLVALSVFIAVLAAGAALDLAGRVTVTQGIAQRTWLGGGAFAMGFGIWSMHYIGMLAYQLPVAVLYDWPTVLLSLLAAVVASGVSLFVVSRATMSWPQTFAGSLLMGAGIAAMHYIGMGAMRLPAMCQYSLSILILSIALAIAISFVALRMFFAFRGTTDWGWRRIATAVTLGAAIPVMHYVGMAAVSFTPMLLDAQELTHAIAISSTDIVDIAVVTIVILGWVFLASMIDRRFAIQVTALLSSEQRFRYIVETAVDAFLEFDRNALLTDWNAHAESTFGWSRAEAIGKNVHEIIVDLPPIFSADISVAKPRRLEITGLRRDGRTFPAEMTVSAIEWNHKSLFAAFVHDVTQRKLAEQERETAKIAAESGSRAKSEFLANMSHEIRTPMNGVIGMADLLLDTTLDPVQRDYAETIRDSGAALLTVINDILDFSKIEAGKLELEHIDMDLRDTIQDVARLISIRAHAKGLEVTVQIDPKLPALVNGDAGRVRQILLNLAANAVKFTDHGELSLKIDVVEIGELDIRVRCEVRDSGIGIPADRLGALFSPFMQVDTSTTRKFEGTGLGLSIVRQLVELMGGEAGVESIVGTGSMFWFTARFALVLDLQRHLPSAPASLQGQRVLVVDDSEATRHILVAQLLQCGVDASAAGSGAAALRLLKEAHAAGNPFEVALLDRHMPDTDGAELGRTINQDEDLKSVRLVVLTSSGQRGDGQLFADIGFAGYLLKPVGQRDLVECLRLVLGNPAGVWHHRGQPIITGHALRTQRARVGNRILLAEDNVVNQKVASRLLAALGFTVQTAANGRAAVAAWQAAHFDLILMDCQMPDMDGYEATREIRRLEANTRHIPIIALTAHAMKGADTACLAAGMDDYLTKPIDRALLASCLERFLPSTVFPTVERLPVRIDQANPVDWHVLFQSTGEDKGLARELVGIFITNGDQALASIAAALSNGDHNSLAESAHALQGASANLWAAATAVAAGQLENAANTGSSAQLPALSDALTAEFKRASDYLLSKVA